MADRYKHFSNSLGRTFCSLRYHENIRTLSAIWKGTATEEDIARLRSEISEMIKQFPVDYILNDLEEFFGEATNKLIAFKVNDWDADVFGHGVKQIVHVLKPDTELTEFYLNQKHLDPQLKFFDNKVDAIMYLTDLQNQT